MKLDKRIKALSDILTCFDLEQAVQFIGQKGYFADVYSSFQNLRNRAYGTLTAIRDSDHPFKMGNNEYCCFFIPEIRLKPVEKKVEKKYRPYTIEEFCNEGFEVMVFRHKNDESLEYHVRYNGYLKYDNDVYVIIFGNKLYALCELFDNFEYLDDDGIWKPFGVEE